MSIQEIVWRHNINHGFARMPRVPAVQLPEQLALFARHMAESGDGGAAAIAAGVHPSRTGFFVREAMNMPAVRQAIADHVRSRFAEAVPLALNLLVSVIKDAKHPMELRVAAAKDVLTRADFTAKGMRDADAAHKDLTEMSPDELRHVLEHTEAELATRAKDVANAPERAPSDYQVIDLEG